VTAFTFEQTTVKRLRAARCARRYPVILDAIADGRLNVSGVVMLRPHLQPESASELLGLAFGKYPLSGSPFR
jgi:hypothetical protein